MEVRMSKETTYTNVRQNLARFCDEVSSTREPVIIRRRKAEDVALIAADELESLMETAHLLRSPENARRLIAALIRSDTKKIKPSSVYKLRKELGI